MRKVFAFLVVGSLLFAACAEDNPTIGGTGGTASGGTGSTTPATAGEIPGTTCASGGAGRDAIAIKSSASLSGACTRRRARPSS